jgi:hypothetical protein
MPPADAQQPGEHLVPVGRGELVDRLDQQCDGVLLFVRLLHWLFGHGQLQDDKADADSSPSSFARHGAQMTRFWVSGACLDLIVLQRGCCAIIRPAGSVARQAGMPAAFVRG